MVSKKNSSKNKTSVELKEKFVSREETLKSVSEIELIYFKYISIIVLVLIASYSLVVSGYWFIGIPILVFFLAIPWIAEKMEELKLAKKS